jgi:hypothetical protein
MTTFQPATTPTMARRRNVPTRETAMVVCDQGGRNFFSRAFSFRTWLSETRNPFPLTGRATKAA